MPNNTSVNVRVTRILAADGPEQDADNAVALTLADDVGARTYFAIYGLPLAVAEVLADGLRAAAKASKATR